MIRRASFFPKTWCPFPRNVFCCFLLDTNSVLCAAHFQLCLNTKRNNVGFWPKRAAIKTSVLLILNSFSYFGNQMFVLFFLIL